MLLYHGSNLAVGEPRLIEPSRGLDFGAGFYLTTSEGQAVRFSELVVKRRKSGAAIVGVYEFDMDAAEGALAIRRFDSADAAWLGFVAENRLRVYRGNAYDMVRGAVANDTVMPTIQLYIGGLMSEEAALVALKASNLADQICLKTERALSLLTFTRAYEV
ncbi:MAG: DUF3990 domain-containing protein [Chitinispirillales bacterium]|jgi:hypothetical protein|nr:DUF3990 domain-containing protein [Chitinispirillales bacterium]